MDQQLPNLLSRDELLAVTGVSPDRLRSFGTNGVLSGHHGRRHSVTDALRIAYIAALIDAGIGLSTARRLAGDTFPEHGELLTTAPLEAAC